jgi:hypothetical protein
LDEADQSHSALVAMLTLTVPPPAPTVALAGCTLYVHPCDWLTENGSPATTAVPVRDLPAVAATAAETVAGPVPDAGVSVSHGTLLDAVHGHAAVVVMAIAAVLPEGAAAIEAGLIAYVHPSDCTTLNFWPATLIVALRGGPVEAGTSNVTTPLPCPDAVRTRTHSASAAADHEHMPLDARTCTWPDPPD